MNPHQAEKTSTIKDGMKQVKISSVQYEMLVALGKRWKMKPEDLITELIEETIKTKPNDESTCAQQVFLMPVQTIGVMQNYLIQRVY